MLGAWTTLLVLCILLLSRAEISDPVGTERKCLAPAGLQDAALLSRTGQRKPGLMAASPPPRSGCWLCLGVGDLGSTSPLL